MKLISLTIILLLSSSVKVCACSPIEPKLIPPADRYGEFTYEKVPTGEEVLLELIAKSKNIAVVKVGIDWHQEKYPYHALTEVEILHGWGYQKGRVEKFNRLATSCGKPKKLKVGGWYVAVLQEGVPIRLLQYESAKDVIAGKGKPEYVYTSMGLLK